jgi:hypothetical protein
MVQGKRGAQPLDLKAGMTRKDVRRPGLLESNRGLYTGPFPGRVDPPHLPGVHEKAVSGSL